jgi:hypothetical protein
MDRDDIRASLRESGQIRIARRDHEMHIKRYACVPPQGAYHGRSNGDIRHKMAIHHIDVDPISARSDDRADFLAEIRKVSGKNRRRDKR